MAWPASVVFPVVRADRTDRHQHRRNENTTSRNTTAATTHAPMTSNDSAQTVGKIPATGPDIRPDRVRPDHRLMQQPLHRSPSSARPAIRTVTIIQFRQRRMATFQLIITATEATTVTRVIYWLVFGSLRHRHHRRLLHSLPALFLSRRLITATRLLPTTASCTHIMKMKTQKHIHYED